MFVEDCMSDSIDKKFEIPVMGEREILMSSNDCLEFEKDLLLIKNFEQLVEEIGLECLELHEGYVIYHSTIYDINFKMRRSPEFVRHAFKTLNSLTPIPGQKGVDPSELILAWEALCSPESKPLSAQQDFIYLREKLGLKLLNSDENYLYYWLEARKRKERIFKEGETGFRLAHLVLKKLNNIYDSL